VEAHPLNAHVSGLEDETPFGVTDGGAIWWVAGLLVLRWRGESGVSPTGQARSGPPG